MKISTNMKKNYFDCYNEAKGFAVNKKYIIKRRKKNLFSYIERTLLIYLFLFVINICINAFINPWKGYIPIFIISLFEIIYLIYIIVNYVRTSNYKGKQKYINTINIDENGITDESYYGIQMLFKWNKIKAIVVGTYTVTILTDTPVYFYFSKEKKESIISAIKKYDNENKIIY